MLETREPTGRPAWPMLLLAGAEKAGKTYMAAEASASTLIRDTYWLTAGEDDPDEYGPLGRFKIVTHDGSHRALVASIHAISALPPGDKPDLIVLDSVSALWAMLSDEGQALANERARRKGKPADGADITMDLWNRAAKRWREVISALRAHQGPVLLTARLAEVTVLGPDGKPSRDGAKQWKVEGHRTLPFDVTGTVQLRSRADRVLTGLRSLRYAIPMSEYQTLPADVTVEAIWRKLGIEDATDRSHVYSDGAQSLAAETAARDDLIARLAKVTNDMDALDRWWQDRHGEPLREASDLAALLQVTEIGEQRYAEAVARQAAAAETAAPPTYEEAPDHAA